MTPEQMLRQFHAELRVYDGFMPTVPTADIPGRVRTSRRDLLAEELDELARALKAGDIVKIADGIGDVVYLLIGDAVVHGIPFDEVFTEIHRSNMTKINVPGAPKLVKGDGYSPPDIAGILARKATATA